MAKNSKVFWIVLVASIFATTGISFAQTVDFTANVTKGCAPLSVNFTAQTSGGTVSTYLWDFGNGNTSTSSAPSTAYATSGIYTVSLTIAFTNNTILVERKTAFISVFNAPRVDFNVSARSGCTPLRLNFNELVNVGSAPIKNWDWDFGNGLGNSLQNPTFVYTGPGIFDVTLIVTDTNDCQVSLTKPSFIDVKPSPKADFTSGTNRGCKAPHTVSFVNFSTSNVSGNTALNYFWSFGNGQQNNSLNASTTYNTIGNYTVQLVVQNSVGCFDTLRRLDYVVIQDVKAGFTATNRSACPPFISQFTNTSSPALLTNKYSWSFGNGMTSSAADTGITYENSGSYEVKLLVETANGCKDSLTRVGYITALNKPTGAILVSDSISCKRPFTAQFSALPSNATSYQWSFGDGSGSVQAAPTKIYNNFGNYSVQLVIRGSNGCNDTVRKEEYIKVNPPQANFTVNNLEGCVPLNVVFTNTSQSVSPITSYFYNFRNGLTANTAAAVTDFVDTGKYRVTFVIRTVDGCLDSTFLNLRAGIKPKADFVSDTLSGCLKGFTARFTNRTNQGNVKADAWDWSLGQGLKSTVENPNINYFISGKQTIQLVALNNGCPDTLRREEYISVLDPTALMTPVAAGCNSDSFLFTNQSIGGQKYLWKFGDGKTSTKTEPSHVFWPGNYEVRLIVRDTITGCIDSTNRFITVNPGFEPSFRGDTVACTKQGVWFFDQTPNTSGWQWDFGTGRKFNGRNVFVQFDQPGFYTVRYSAVVNGCRSTAVKTNYLHVYGPKLEHVTPDLHYCPPVQLNIVKQVDSERPLSFDKFSLYKDKSDSIVYLSSPDTIPYYFERAQNPQDSGYVIFMYGEDVSGCRNWLWDTIRVSRPYSKVSSIQAVSCLGSRYIFEGELIDTTNIGVASVLWDFDNGQSDDSTYASYTYFTDGDYDVKYITTDLVGCTDTVLIPLNVEIKDLKAGFRASDTFKNCPPFLVRFTDTSIDSYNGINQWEWSFGDGTKLFFKSPQKVFNYPGSYPVSLKITDTAGCSDSVFFDDLITLGGSRINYTIDTLQGCEPLDITVNVVTDPPGGNVIWLMGDGSLVESMNFKHTYLNHGQYIPTAIIKDPICEYALNIVDTVKINKSPVSDFNYAIACLGEATTFIDRSVFDPNETITYNWNFGDGSPLNNDVNPFYQFSTGGTKNVTLRAVNALGCGIPITKNVLVPFVEAKLTNPGKLCANDSFKIQFSYTGLGDFITADWIFGDGKTQSNTDSSITYAYTQKGIYRPKAYLTNAYGCTDSAVEDKSVLVGDDFAPTVPQIWNVNVLSDNEVGVTFRETPSIDFEKYIVYRRRPFSQVYDSIEELINVKDTFWNDADKNTLNFTYTYKIRGKNFCGYYSSLDSSIPHTTVESKAFRADDASRLVWTPYEGWPVSQYHIYRLTDQGNFALLQVLDGNTFETFDSAIVCNTGYIYRVQALGSHPLHLSNSDTAGTIPNYIPFVRPSDLLYLSLEDPDRVEMEWNSSTGGRVPVVNYFVEKSQDNRTYVRMKDTFDAQEFFREDFVNRTNERNWFYRIVTLDSCGYFSEPSNYGKTIVLRTTIDTATDLPKLYWNSYEQWQEGIAYYEVEVLEDGAFKFLSRVLSDTFFIDNKSDLFNKTDYCYRVTAFSNKAFRSKSNIACAPIVSRIWVPNAFRPDGWIEDNKRFTPKGMFLRDYSIKIFNRWGQVLFESRDINNRWDGTYKGQAVSEGTYIYAIEAIGADGRFHSHNASLLLLR